MKKIKISIYIFLVVLAIQGVIFFYYSKEDEKALLAAPSPERKYELSEINHILSNIKGITVEEYKYIDGKWVSKIIIQGEKEQIKEEAKRLSLYKITDFKLWSDENATTLYIEMQW